VGLSAGAGHYTKQLSITASSPGEQDAGHQPAKRGACSLTVHGRLAILDRQLQGGVAACDDCRERIANLERAALSRIIVSLRAWAIAKGPVGRAFCEQPTIRPERDLPVHTTAFIGFY
jgi:hypothetical protein